MRSQQIDLGALVRVIPAELIVGALRETKRESTRRRKLPAEHVVWLLIGMALFRRLSIELCAERVFAALEWTGFRETPHSTSITQARDRLGFDVVRLIFRKFAALLWQRHGHLSKWRDLNVLTVDGSTLRTPDTAANDREFGRPGVSSRGKRKGKRTGKRKGKSAFPQLRVVAVLSAWTHLIVGVRFGPYSHNEQRLALSLLPEIPENSLLLLDRAYHSFVWPGRLREHAIHFVMKARTGKSVIATKRGRRLGRGDYLAHLLATENTRRLNRDLPSEIQVRLITRTRRGFRPITLVTSLLSPELYPAQSVFDLYADRWEAELAFRELKTELNQEWVVFRSRKPARVLQEAYGLLLAYNCVRALMCEAAVEAGVKPLQLSFKTCLVRVQWFLSGGAPFEDFEQLLAALGLALLDPRRAGRSCDRAVKMRATKYPVKRSGQKPAKTRYQTQRQRYEQRRKRLALSA